MAVTYRERTFDWVSRHDVRSRNYPIRTELPAVVQRRPRLWLPGPSLDQGREGACVGHSWVNEATASPVRVDLTRAALPGLQGSGQPWPRDPQALAFAVYLAAQRVDEWEGEAYDGTSVLAGAKVMQRLGLLREYRWAFGIDDVVATVIAHGPVVLGIPWLDGMYEAPGGEIRATGVVVGGHAILAHGYHPAKVVNGRPAREMVRLENSWGLGYGEGGGGWISLDDLAWLLEQDGEACAPAHRSYGRESTLRRWWHRLFGALAAPARAS
jgi:hypothetical protein